MKILRSEQRGLSQISWLKSRHSFSFGEYWNHEYVSFKSLRVINEDWIAGAGGFPSHPHADMEILTYVLSGALEHKDSTGSEGVIRAGDIQLMTAGRGIVHSERNHSQEDQVHLLQIWMHPRQKALPAQYQQKTLGSGLEEGAWVRLLRPYSELFSLEKSFSEKALVEDSSLKPQQEVELWAKRFSSGEKVEYKFLQSHDIWLQVVKGELESAGELLKAGDAFSAEKVSGLNLVSNSESEILLFVF
jgi:quercetin 2,3-dioxygenase